MANMAYLLSDDNVSRYFDLQGSKVLCAASYFVPIFWYSLFEEADLIEMSTPTDEGGQYKYPMYIKEKKEALSLAYSRIPIIKKNLKNVSDKWFNIFHDYLNEQNGKLIILEPCEITWMDKKVSKYTKESKKCIQAFNTDLFETKGLFFKKTKMSKPWETLLTQADVTDIESDMKIYNFCGGEWEKDIPWECA